jgi:galactose mutarotase-like enzyme
MPLLFPQAGAASQAVYPLPNHGFTRTMSWSVVESTENSLTLSLESTPETREVYPFNFALRAEISLLESSLVYILKVDNHSAIDMPIAPGLHPYFEVPNQERSSVSTSITGFDPSTFTGPETLFFPNQSPVTLSLPDATILMNASAEFRELAIWSEPAGDYLCIEPWTGGVDAISEAETAVMVPAGKSVHFSVSLEYQAKTVIA